jgi:hypothetical protein
MVSTIVEPKIIEKLDLGNVESRFAGRPSDKETPPPAFRLPDRPAYAPPERRQNDKPVITVEMKSEAPSTPRPLPPTVAPPAPPTEIIGADDFPLDLEAFGEDAPPEEPPQKIKHRFAETPAPIKAREERPKPATPAKTSPKPDELLPIDLRDLMQRPTAPPVKTLEPPVLDKPAAPREYEPPRKIDKPANLPPAQPAGGKIIGEYFPPTAELKKPATPPEEPVSFPTATLPVEPEPTPIINTRTILVNSPAEMEEALTRLQQSVESAGAPAAPTVIEPVQLRSERIVPEKTKIESIIPLTPPPIAPAPPVTAPQMLAPTPPAEAVAPVVISPPVTIGPASQPAEAIAACLAQLLKNRPAAKPKLVIIGREGQHVSPMLRHILGTESSLRRMQSAVFQYLEIGERKVEAQPFEIIGISMEQQFTRLLDAAGPDLLGYLVIIEAHRKERIEYLSYLVNMLNNVYRRPLGIGIIKSADQKNMAADTLRDLLNIGAADFLQECTPTDKLSVAEFLKGFTSEANLSRWREDNKK